jgi:hypothetical protein
MTRRAAGETTDGRVAMLDAEIEGARAWRRDEISPADWLVPLDERCLAELDEAVARIGRDPLPVALLEPAEFRLEACARAIAAMSERLRSGIGLAVLDGVPVERYGLEENRALFWLLGSLLGRPVAQKWDGSVLSSSSWTTACSRTAAPRSATAARPAPRGTCSGCGSGRKAAAPSTGRGRALSEARSPCGSASRCRSPGRPHLAPRWSGSPGPTLEDLAARIEARRRMADAEGRDPAALTLSYQAPLAFDADAPPTPFVTFVGGPDEILRRIERCAALGVSHVVSGWTRPGRPPTAPVDDFLRTMERFVTGVRPRL